MENCTPRSIFESMDISFKLAIEHSDLEVIESLAQQIWTEHYTPIIGEKQVAYMLDKFQSVHAMKEQQNTGYCYYLLSMGNASVGYLSFLAEEDNLFLSKIYLLSKCRGKGVGAKSMEFIVEQANLKGLRGVRLTVNKYNNKSIAAYTKMGFKTLRAVVFDIGQGYIMDDYEMHLELKKATTSN